MASVASGVLPVFKNKFKISKTGKSGAEADMVTIADVETFSVSVDNGVEEWTPMDTEGWIRRLMTGKGFAISLSGKRNIGDPGNDYIAGLLFKTGQDTESKFLWEMPSGTKVMFDCVVNVSSAGGDSTGAEGLECEVMSNGAPTVTPAGASA